MGIGCQKVSVEGALSVSIEATQELAIHFLANTSNGMKKIFANFPNSVGSTSLITHSCFRNTVFAGVDSITGGEQLAYFTEGETVRAKIGYEDTVSIVIANESAFLKAKNTNKSVKKIILMDVTGSVVAEASDWRLSSSSCLMD